MARRSSLLERLHGNLGGILGGLIVTAVLLVAAVYPIFVTDPNAQDITSRLLAPGRSSGAGVHPLGTDAL
jgi:hypothetical protein